MSITKDDLLEARVAGYYVYYESGSEPHKFNTAEAVIDYLIKSKLLVGRNTSSAIAYLVVQNVGVESIIPVSLISLLELSRGLGYTFKGEVIQDPAWVGEEE